MIQEPICLSSDEEDSQIPKKKRKLGILSYIRNDNEESKANTKKDDSIICLDSDEEVGSEKESHHQEQVDSDDVILISKDLTSPKSNADSSVKLNEKNSNAGCAFGISKNDLKSNSQVEEMKGIDKKETLSVEEQNSKINGTIKPATENSVESQNHNEVLLCRKSPILNSNDNLSDCSNEVAGESEGSSDSDSSVTEYYEEEELQSQDSQKSQLQKTEDSGLKHEDLLANTEDLPDTAKTYLSTCVEMLKNTSADPIYKKFPVVIKMVRSLSEEFTKNQYLHKFMNRQTDIARESVSCCIVSFRDVYQHLKDSINSQSIEMPKEHRKHLKKLEKFMEKLVEKLKQLEEAEIDFEDEEDNSAYIKHDLYSRRLNKVYEKYCKILKKNPHAGRITYERLDFVSSNYNEINQAISKKYKNNKIFPSYDEIAQLIQTVVEEKSLPLHDALMKVESEMCFKKLGDLLQTRRKKELYESHQKYLTGEDPAKSNSDLENKLRISHKEGKVRIEQICQEFVKKQELGLIGEEVDISESEECDEEESDVNV